MLTSSSYPWRPDTYVQLRARSWDEGAHLAPDITALEEMGTAFVLMKLAFTIGKGKEYFRMSHGV